MCMGQNSQSDSIQMRKHLRKVHFVTGKIDILIVKLQHDAVCSSSGRVAITKVGELQATH